MMVEVSLQFGEFPNAKAHRAVLKKSAVKSWVAHALDLPGEIGIRIVGEGEGRAMNLQYRGKDYATNVLTFDYSSEPVVTADLVLCAPVVEREAAEQKKSLESHYAHLIMHGTLHAAGYDHESNERDALKMEALEVLLMGSLGYANPY